MAIKTLKHVDPFDSAHERGQAGVLGMWLFIVVVAMIFIGCILGYLVVRLDRPPGQAWMPAQDPGLPKALLVSTAMLLISSWTVQTAVRASRQGLNALAHHALGWTMAFAGVFLVVQTFAWFELWRRDLTIDSGLYAWTFYVLTGVHALHVLGGIPPLVITYIRSARGAYTPAHNAGLVCCAMYWHALDVIWLALYATLWLGSR